MPLLSIYNCFKLLTVDKISESNLLPPTKHNEMRAIPKIPHHHPKWEKCLLEQYIVTSNPGANLLELEISMQTTNTGEIHSTKALLDSGATGMFLNADFVKQK